MTAPGAISTTADDSNRGNTNYKNKAIPTAADANNKQGRLIACGLWLVFNAILPMLSHSK